MEHAFAAHKVLKAATEAELGDVKRTFNIMACAKKLSRHAVSGSALLSAYHAMRMGGGSNTGEFPLAPGPPAVQPEVAFLNLAKAIEAIRGTLRAYTWVGTALDRAAGEAGKLGADRGPN